MRLFNLTAGAVVFDEQSIPAAGLQKAPETGAFLASCRIVSRFAIVFSVNAAFAQQPM